MYTKLYAYGQLQLWSRIKMKNKQIIEYKINMDQNEIKSYLINELDEFHFRLESVNPVTHDNIVNSQGAFEKMWQTLDYVSDKFPSTKIVFNTNITKQNVHEIASTFGWIVNFGAYVKFGPTKKSVNKKIDISINKIKNLDFLKNTINDLKKKKLLYPKIILNSIDELEDIFLFHQNIDE